MNPQDEMDRVRASSLDIARSRDGYRLSIRTHSFGERLSFIPVSAVLEDLQDSRGITVLQADSVDDVIERGGSLDLDERDRTRIHEALSAFAPDLPRRHVDVGFRVPRLVSHFSGLGVRSLGLDISRLNVSLARSLGFEAYPVDISSPSWLPKPEDGTLITCYHVLEHTPDPIASLRSLVSMMGPGSILHLEVPLEPGEPRIRFGHLSEFRAGDLPVLLADSGLRVLRTTLIDASERVLAAI